MLFFWVLKGYIVWGSRRTYQAVKEALSCFLPIGPLPVSPGRPVSLWQQLLAACGGRGWAAQLQTSVGPEPGPPSSLFLFRTHTHIHRSPQSAQHKGLHSSPSYSLYWWRGRLKLPSSHSFLPPLSPSTSPVTLSDIPSLLKLCLSPSLSLLEWMFFHTGPWDSHNH